MPEDTRYPLFPSEQEIEIEQRLNRLLFWCRVRSVGNVVMKSLAYNGLAYSAEAIVQSRDEVNGF